MFLPTAHFVILRPHFPIRQAQFVQVFPLKPAPFCKLSADVGSTNKSAIPLRLSLCSRHYVFSFVFPFTANSLAHLTKTVLLSSDTMRLQLVPGDSFLPEDNDANKFARRGTLLLLSAIPCSLSPFISLIRSYLFSDWRPSVSSKFFDIQVPSIFTEQLVLPRHARCTLSHLRYNGHNLSSLLPF